MPIGELLQNRSLWGIFGYITSLGLSFVTYVVFAKLLSVDDLGSLILFGSLVTSGGLLFQFGLARTALVLTGRATGRDDSRLARNTYVRLCFMMLGGVGSVSLILLLFGQDIASYIFHGRDVGNIVPILLLMVVATFYMNLASESLRGAGFVRQQVFAVQVFLPVMFLAAIVLCALIAGGIDVLSIIYLQTITWAAVAAALLLLTYRLLGSRPAPAARPPATADDFSVNFILQNSLPIWAINIVFLMQTQADVWIVSAILTPAHVAAYGIALKATVLVVAAHRGIEGAIVHKLASASEQGDYPRMQRVLQSASLITFGVAFIPSILIILWPAAFISVLFSKELVIAAPALAILTGSRLLGVALGHSEVVLIVTGHQKFVSALTAVMGLLSLVLVAAGCLAFGLIGAALGNALAHLAQKAVTYYAMRRRLPVHAHARWSSVALTELR